MIIVYLKGGLGNQLFQYAAARNLAHIHNTVLKLDTKAFYYGGPKQYELCYFNIRADIAQTSEIQKLIEVKQNKYQKLLHTLLHNKPRLSPNHFKYNKTMFYDGFFNLPDNIYLDGYFQNEKYFINIADTIRREFTLKNALTGKNREIAELMKNNQSISISVRRGEYVTDPKANKKHGVCDIDYYYNGIEQINLKIDSPHFFVFSDDIDWCKRNLKISYPVYFIDHQQEKPYENLWLMSLCKNHIISNSTFSWWGAWLSSSKNKIVLAPKKWFAQNDLNNSDLLPKNWIKI